MADTGVIKNITTALSKIFSRSKPREFETRQSIEQALAITKSSSATNPQWEPTTISNKGFGSGVFFDRSEGQHFHRYLERENARHTRYAIYEKMDSDIIASALDVYANEGTQKNQNNTVIAVHSQSKYIQDELTDMLEDTGLNNYKSWSIIRDMCKFGDRFEAVKIDSKHGVVKLTTLDAKSVYRVEHDGELQGYVQDLSVLKNQYSAYTGNSQVQSPFIDLNALMQPYINGRKNSISDEDHDEDIIPFNKYELMHFRLRGGLSTDSYGRSILDSAIDVWKKLDLIQDSIIIYRLNRAPSRLVFYVDVGNNQGADIENLVKKQINAINKKEFFDPTGRVNERYQLLDMNANIFIPVGKNSTGSKVDMLAGASGVSDIEDMQYLTNRLFSALKVPKSFLGFGEGEASSKGTLSQQSVTFGKAIQNIQEDFLEAIKDLCIIHLAVKGISSEKELKSFDLVMTRPSYIEEKARMEVESELVNLAQSYIGLKVNTEWVVRNILRRTEAEMLEMLKPDPLQQEPGAGGMGGGMPMGGDLGGDLGGTPDMSGSDIPPDMAQPTPDMGGAPMPDMSGAAPAPDMQPMMQGRVLNGLLLYEQNNTSAIATRSRCKYPHMTMHSEYKVVLETYNHGSEEISIKPLTEAK